MPQRPYVTDVLMFSQVTLNEPLVIEGQGWMHFCQTQRQTASLSPAMIVIVCCFNEALRKHSTTGYKVPPVTSLKRSGEKLMKKFERLLSFSESPQFINYVYSIFQPPAPDTHKRKHTHTYTNT